MLCRKVPGMFFLAAFPFFLFLMAYGAGALGISDGTFSPQTGVERGKAYSQSVLLLNSPNRDNHLVVTVGGDVGAWVTSISPSDFNLTANQQQLIALAISVPANATFGSHAGTVTATATDPAGGAGIIEATKGNLYATVMGSVVCGDGVCDSGESSSTCCLDCPSTASGGGVSYGPWYCSGSSAKARLVSNSSYVCNSQTKAYEYVTTNATEALQCEAGTVCSGGSCIVNQTAPVCGNNVCESGESSSNCCLDCPLSAVYTGSSYGSWYCKDSAAKARVVSTTTNNFCSNQTKAYEYVTTNTTEAQACSSGQVCSGGACITNQTSPTNNASLAAVCGNGVCESGESCSSDCGGDYFVTFKGGLIDDLGSKWKLYDHDTSGPYSHGEYNSNDNLVYEVVKSGVRQVRFSMGGSDWRAMTAYVSSDGKGWSEAKNVCCYGSGEYSFDAPSYSPFYLNFSFGTGSCCGTSSYVTLDKALTLETTTPPSTNVTNATRNEFYWNVDWIDLNSATSGREDSLSVSPGQAVSGKFAYTMWNGPNCRGGCDCIDEIVLGLEGDPKHCFYAGIPWCYPGQSGEAKFSFTAPEKAGTYNLYYAAAQAYTCDVANDVYRTSTGRKLAGKLVVSGTSVGCTDSDGGNDNYAAGYVTYNGVSYKDYCAQPVPRQDGTVALDSVSSCSGSDCSVFEYWCGGSQGIESQSYPCPQGCKDGACLTQAVLELSLATDRSGYSAGDEVKISAKTHTAGALVDAYVKGLVARPDGGSDELVFARESCVQPACKPGEPCIQVACPVQTGYLNAFYKPSSAGAYYIKATASYGGSLAESSAKFAVGVQKKTKLSAWLGNYNYNPGDTVKIFAKLTDDKGEPVLGADVSARIYWAGNVRPVYRELVGIESAAAKKAVQAVETAAARKVEPASAKLVETQVQKASEAQITQMLTLIDIADYSLECSGDAAKKLALSLFNKGSTEVNVLGVVINGRKTESSLKLAPGNVGTLSIEEVQDYLPKLSASSSVQADIMVYAAEGYVKKSMSIDGKRCQQVKTEDSSVQPVAAIPVTGYAVASIASSVEKQVAAPEAAGITYEEEMRIKTSEQTTASSSVVVQPSVRQDIIVVPSKPGSGYLKLDYNPTSRYYEGSYSIPSDAGAGTYKVVVSASAEGQYLQESTSFTLGGEDYYSFENKAKKFASDGNYRDCVDNYLKAADRLSADQYRMFLDIEKAGICARLGSLPNSFYENVGKIVEKAAGEGKERYVLLGIASQYYELGGEYRLSRELLGRAASGLENISGVLDKEQSILAKSVLAKYYALLGEDSKAADYYREAAGLFAGRQSSGSEAFIANLFAARLYAKAGDLDSSRKQYLIAADALSGKSPGSDALITAFIAGDSYERAGEPEKAREQYTRVVGLNAPSSYGAGDSFFAYGAIGKSYERLGEKQKAKEMYEAGLGRLLSKQDAESYYFASGLSGYLGDYGKSKELCRKQFEQSLSEDSNIGKLTFMNAYCYSVLGDGLRAKKGCDLNSITLQGDTMVMEILEPLPPPVSYCSQSTDTKRTSSCGNGVVDAGESPENCCADTGCAFGDTCSKALGKCVKPVKEIPQESILEVLLGLEDARIKLDTLEGKALAISKYYSGKDQPKSDAWGKAASVFGDAKSRIDGIKKDLKDNREKITEDTLEGIRQKLEDVRGSLKQAVDAILEAV